MASVVRSKLSFIGKSCIKPLVRKSIRAQFDRQRLRCFHVSAILNVEGQEVKMPSLSPTMTEGKIIKWMKKEGDAIAPGDVLCEIQTDKAVMSFETEEEGILAKILVPENSPDVKVGTLIALTVGEGEDWKTVDLPGGGSGAAPSPPSGGASAAATGGSVPGQEVKMPSLSPTMTEGTIVQWLKKEGDAIAPGDVLCEIQTDKAVMSFETEEEGILAKILVSAGTKDVKVGTLIALTVGEGEDWKDVEVPGAAGASPAATPVQAQPTFTGGSVSGQEVKMPSLSPTMTEGVIVQWMKKEGDALAPGDILCEIQTDKAVMSFETEEEGILAKILVPEGSKDPIKVGTLIALTVGEGEDWKDVAIPTAGAAPPVPATQAPTAPAGPASPAVSHEPHNYGPAVHRLLSQYQLSANQITPSGRNKKLLKGDVLKYISDNKLQPKPPLPVPPPGQQATTGPVTTASPAMAAPAPSKPRSGYTDHELSSMRKTIAKRLTMSKTEIPHAYSQVEAEIGSLLSLRKQLAQVGVKVSLNDFVIKAVALSLRQCPYMNTLYINDQIIPQATVDISVAVATDAGLITPIVKDADTKSVDQISADVRDLATRAREGKLQLHEFQGGSFTISNLGMFGISEFSAIINPPQCAILAVGGGRAVFDGNARPVTLMTSTLSYDSRSVEPDEVAAFMAVLRAYLQNPASLLLPSQTRRQVAVQQMAN
ncbi:pyruvate dehydrogenase protein X component, mitochondrial-like [Macrosteles quadrilineatus]|uniref:pyruvate dehydrogenase protein X component, mitochondrial-like n=1 Tax=Macrosteles quadrilineatus TaxID=74068 RepID=UPI0023E30FDD|nr:pyruvate dehydrogenase protein X component, mitochondrial-like [Macrosteles quadrilineatus]